MIRNGLMLLVFAVLFCSNPEYASAEEIYLTSSEYPPYHGENLKNQGFITEIIKEAFKRVGYGMKVKFYPFARAFWLAKKGDSDGIFTLWETEKREKLFLFSNPIPPDNIVGFYKRKDKKITFKNYQDLKPYRIGSVLEYAYPADFLESGLINIVEYTDAKLIKNLVAGRIDLAIIEKTQAQYLLQTNFPKQSDNFELMEPSIATMHQHLAISKKTMNGQNIINDFNHGLKAIQDDGTFDGILKKHGF